MKNERSKRSVRIEFVVSEQESELIKERMEQIGVTNLSAYLRKMAVDGYIINLDMTDIQEMTRLLRICSNNLNQYAKRANETGSVYAADIEDLNIRLDGLWDAAKKLLCGFATVSCKSRSSITLRRGRPMWSTAKPVTVKSFVQSTRQTFSFIRRQRNTLTAWGSRNFLPSNLCGRNMRGFWSKSEKPTPPTNRPGRKCGNCITSRPMWSICLT